MKHLRNHEGTLFAFGLLGGIILRSITGGGTLAWIIVIALAAYIAWIWYSRK